LANKVDFKKEKELFQSIIQLTPAHLEFLETVANVIRSTTISRKMNLAPRKIRITEDITTDFRRLSIENLPDNSRLRPRKLRFLRRKSNLLYQFFFYSESMLM